MKQKKILAIESSCDEFSVAIVDERRHKLMMETLSQIDVHAQFGGVIPELASREHTKLFPLVMEKVGTYLNGDWNAIDEVAVTVGPGLSGSLLVGIQVAKTIALMLDKPLVPVHHILGHVYSAGLTNEIVYPMLSLVVSGGHTELIISMTETEHTVIGATRDDAVGEVYDKIARKLHLPYPGGPCIDKLAHQGTITKQFTKPKMNDPFAFSFSGLKSAVMNEINRCEMKGEQVSKEDISASFQSLVIGELIGKIELALQKYSNIKTVNICGGVSANRGLRSTYKKLEDKYKDIKFILPELEYCGDNAAMIGAAYLTSKPLSKEEMLTLDCRPNLTIHEFLNKQKI